MAEALAQMCAITGCDATQAQFLLQAYNGNLESAIAAYFDGVGGGAGGGGGGDDDMGTVRWVSTIGWAAAQRSKTCRRCPTTRTATARLEESRRIAWARSCCVPLAL
jgi:hypothetical protein